MTAKSVNRGVYFIHTNLVIIFPDKILEGKNISENFGKKKKIGKKLY